METEDADDGTWVAHSGPIWHFLMLLSIWEVVEAHLHQEKPLLHVFAGIWSMVLIEFLNISIKAETFFKHILSCLSPSSAEMWNPGIPLNKCRGFNIF